MTDHVLVERHGAVQVIRINRPDKKNALTQAMYETMAAALRDGDDDPAVRAHVFFGVPGAFSAGNDMQDFLAYSTGGALGRDVNSFLLALSEAKKPMLAGVDGLAIGIGTTIQFHCDRTIASPRALFHTPFTDLGIIPEAGSTLIGPLVLGQQKAFELLAMGRGWTADQALAAGLISEIAESDQLEAAVMAVAEEIAAKPPEAMQLTRELLRMPREAVRERITLETRHFSARLKSDEAREAFMAFMSRKK
jgi:enoyl-CoA hydratase/carnithine racemase